jgi:hypothetical protein
VAAGTARDEEWARAVSSLVRAELDRRASAMRAAGRDPADLGSPAQLAERLLSALPEPSAWNALGPFYSTTGVCRLLGGVSRQAVEDRRRRQRLVALRTEEGAWVYPAFQFDDRNRPVPSIVAAFHRLAGGRVGAWTAAAALLGPQPELGGRSIAAFLAAGGDEAVVVDLLDTTVAALG